MTDHVSRRAVTLGLTASALAPAAAFAQSNDTYSEPEIVDAAERFFGAGAEGVAAVVSHVFEDLGYRRFEWKCNNRNEPSKRAAERFGFTFEGVFRQHMIARGQNRDTAWFSMLDGEWPVRKAGFERWLDGTNFDASGMQHTPLDVR